MKGMGVLGRGAGTGRADGTGFRSELREALGSPGRGRAAAGSRAGPGKGQAGARGRRAGTRRRTGRPRGREVHANRGRAGREAGRRPGKPRTARPDPEAALPRAPRDGPGREGRTSERRGDGPGPGSAGPGGDQGLTRAGRSRLRAGARPPREAGPGSEAGASALCRPPGWGTWGGPGLGHAAPPGRSPRPRTGVGEDWGTGVERGAVLEADSWRWARGLG